MKLKVCGMKINDNIKEVAKLLPDFMGFIFWPKTKRFFSEKEISIPNHVKKVGVFVNQDLDLIKKNVKKFGLDFVQLHGNENKEFCSEVNSFCKVIKVFHLSENFNFEKLAPFEKLCKYYLFDTKSEKYGGSGQKFNWSILKNYNSSKGFFISGGIDISDVNRIIELKKMKLPIFGIDVNSKFEIRPGLKNKTKIEKLINKLNNENILQH